MSEVMPLRIALVDDHRILMDGIEALLSSDESYQVLVQESSGTKLIERSDLNELDVIVMDLICRNRMVSI